MKVQLKSVERYDLSDLDRHEIWTLREAMACYMRDIWGSNDAAPRNSTLVQMLEMINEVYQ